MQLNRPQAKIRFKLVSNRLLIYFFDSISLPDLIKIVGTVQIRTRIRLKKSICIENSSNLIENSSILIKNGQKQLNFQHI